MRRLLLVSALLVSGWSMPSAGQEQVGWADWIHPSTTGVPPSTRTARRIAHGDSMELDEEVNTNRSGLADFVFDNDARLLMGKNCEVRLDRSFYDSELDRRVTEMEVSTVDICLLKVELAQVNGRIVIRTPSGNEAVMQGSDATYAHRDGDGRSPQPMVLDQYPDQLGTLPDGLAGAADLVIASGTMAPGGSILINGETAIRRPGFVVTVLKDGSILGPDPLTADLSRTFNSGFENVVEPQDWTGTLTLEAEPEGQVEPPSVPRNCIFGECEYRQRPFDHFDPS